MTFEGKRVVVLGATGVVGSEVVRAYLDRGASVAAVSRSAQKLDALRAAIGVKEGEALHPVVGDFTGEDAADAARESATTALGGPIDHVVSSIGFVQVAGPPTATEGAALRSALDNGLFNNFFAAKAFVPALKGRAGSSFTMVSGGLAHFAPPSPTLWLGTMKNAALNALTLGLASETAKDAVRVNTICIHFSVAPRGGTQNQLGMPAERDSSALAAAFLGLAKGTQRGSVICLDSWAAADRLA